MPSVRAPLIVEIGEAVELWKAIGVILVHDMYLHFAESPGKLDLSAGREVLRREQQYLIAQVGLIDRVENFVADVICQLDARDLGGEMRGQWTHGKWPAKFSD